LGIKNSKNKTKVWEACSATARPRDLFCMRLPFGESEVHGRGCRDVPPRHVARVSGRTQRTAQCGVRVFFFMTLLFHLSAALDVEAPVGKPLIGGLSAHSDVPVRMYACVRIGTWQSGLAYIHMHTSTHAYRPLHQHYTDNVANTHASCKIHRGAWASDCRGST
jgi:hypothetical protein